MKDIKMTQDGVERNSMRMGGIWKEQRTELKTRLKEQKEGSRSDKYKSKKMQGKCFFKIDKESHQWLKASNIIINPILIRVYPHKRGWLDLPQQQSL